MGGPIDGSTSPVPSIPIPPGVGGTEARSPQASVDKAIKDDLEKLGVTDLSQLTPQERATLNRLAREFYILNTAEPGEPQLIPPESTDAPPEGASTLTKEAADYFAALGDVVKRLAENAEEVATPGSVSPGVDPDQAAIQDMAAAILAQAKAAARSHVGGGSEETAPTGPNQALAGTSVAYYSMVSIELAKLLSNIAGQDAILGVKLRQAIREMVQSERDAIERQGQLEKSKYEELATAKLASAITSGVTGLASMVGHSYVERSGTNRGLSETQIKIKTDRFQMGTHTLQSVTSSSTDAATNFIEASYAVDIKTEESRRLFFQSYGQSLSGAREDQLRKVGESRQQMDSILQKLDQFSGSAHRININPHQG